MRPIILIVLILSILRAPALPQSHAEQVKAIQNDARVKAAFDHIDKNREGILREWMAITEINAPSKQEQERAKFIESLLRKHKLEVRYDSAGKLIATRKGTGGEARGNDREDGADFIVASRHTSGQSRVAPGKNGGSRASGNGIRSADWQRWFQ